MSTEGSITVPKHVLSESLNDETVILDMDAGTYFGLSPVATRFWNLLNTGLSLEEIQSKLTDEFDVDGAVLRADLDSLLADLAAKKLILRQVS
jgi:hypothetical protein